MTLKNNFLMKFIGPMLIGVLIAQFNMFLVDKGTMGDIVFIRILYTFAENYMAFIKWFAPIMSFVFIASGIRNLRGNVVSFVTRFFSILVITLSILALFTLAVAYTIVPLFISTGDFISGPWPEAYFILWIFKPLNIFYCIVAGFIFGLFASKGSKVEKIIDYTEKYVVLVINYFIIPFSPFWIMGSFAASTFSDKGLGIIWIDLWLSFVILCIHFIWLFVMYLITSKYAKVALNLIIKAAFRMYIVVVSMAGNSNGVIVPLIIDEQEKLGFNKNKAKFVSVSSFNMPGSLISNIIFAYGVSYMFDINITPIVGIKYAIILIFLLIVAPAINGGVWTLTSGILSPVLGFKTDMINIMGSMYFKQGTSNSAVNNCADFYVTGLCEKKEKNE
ncbi:MAG: cation:dicarboxylate symporter family transporter [Mycoplasmatales bacterium]